MTPDKITIHCSDTPDGVTDVDAAEIKKWHLARGFKDIGYHLVIRRNGEVEKGRALNEIGAHVEGHNDGNIGICLVGRDTFTREQFAALRYQLDSLFMNFMHIPKWGLYTHRQFNPAKTCPNMELNRLLLWYHLNDQRAIEPYIYQEAF